MKKIKKVTSIEPAPSRCIEVDDPRRLFAIGGESGKGMVSHNSVVQRNMIITSLLRANQPEEHINLIMIDLKIVELSTWRGYKGVLGVATNLEDAVLSLEFAQAEMMRRYTEMGKMGINDRNILSVRGEKNPLGPALIVIIDELGELMSSEGAGKALSEDSLVYTKEGYKPLKEIQIGDILYDKDSMETKVINKYKPAKQDHYKMTFRSSSREMSRDFTSGAEHDWLVKVVFPDGSESDFKKVSTENLYSIKRNEDRKPLERRGKVIVRRSKSPK